jgi:hypothetical protein
VDVGDHGGVAAVVAGNVLDDLLATVMLDVEIDVGRLGARGTTLEQEVHADGIDRGDAER